MVICIPQSSFAKPETAPDQVSELKSVTAKTLFISPTGSNTSGNGTQTAPWQTLVFALSQAAFGDTVFFMPGIYSFNSTVNIPRGVSLKGAGEQSVITSGFLGDWDPIFRLASNPIATGNQNISYLRFDGNSLRATFAIWVSARHNVHIHNCTFVDFLTSAVHFESNGSWANTNIPPPNYSTGNKFFNNQVRNSSRGWHGSGSGSISVGGQEGMEIYNNHMTQIGRPAGQNGWLISMGVHGGWVRGLKIYNNHLEKHDMTLWPFAIEGFHHFGIEIFNNRIIGTIDLNHVSRGGYEFGAKISGNVIGPDIPTADKWVGIYLEFSAQDVIIMRNHFINNNIGISYTPRNGSIISNNFIEYNVFENLGAGSLDNSYAGVWTNISGTGSYSLSNIHVRNNVFHAHPTLTQSAWFGLELSGNPSSNINVVNNIFLNFRSNWMRINPAGIVNGLNVRNNIFFNNGNHNQPQFVNGTPANYTNLNNSTADPRFVGSGNFRLQSTSPAINAAHDLGLSGDFAGNPVPFNGIPDKGAFEFGSVASTGSFIISLSSNPAVGGTTSGGGNFTHGQNATVAATAAQGYTFANWTENGTVVSANASFTFGVTRNRTLTANFATQN